MSEQSGQRVAVVTGASSGIGKETAKVLLAKGWHVIVTGRTPERCAAAETELRALASPAARLDFLRGDFCEMKDVMRVAGEIKGLADRLDLLVNNAGGVRDQRYVSSEGLEATMAANHFASFLLTRELLPLLEAAAARSEPGSVRVIAVASSAHEVCPGMRFGDLCWDTDYAASPIYCQAKLANILFTRELARRIEGDGVIAHSMHPGLVKSNFFNHGDAGMQSYAAQQEGVSSEHAAKTVLWMIDAPEAGAPGGRYFHECGEIQPAPQAQDDEAAARLWQETEEILSKLGY